MSSDVMLSEPARQDLGVSDSVLLPDVQQAAEVESVESPLLSGIGRPQLTVIKENRPDTSLVDAHLCPFTQQVIAPHSLVEFGHDSSCFGNPATDLSIE